MPKGAFNLVLNTVQNLEQAKLMLDRVFKEHTITDGEIFHLFLKPFAAPKTHVQLAAIRVLCNQLSEKVDGEYSHYTSEKWYRYYKLRAYVPLLKIDAHEKNDESLIALIDKASQIIKASQEATLFSTNPIQLLDLYNEYLLELAKSQNYTAIGLVSEAKRTFFKSSKGKDIIKVNDDYTISDFVSDNSAFSYADASKENLIKVIDYMIKHSADNGIELKLEKKDYKDEENEQ